MRRLALALFKQMAAVASLSLSLSKYTDETSSVHIHLPFVLYLPFHSSNVHIQF
jgi:hypothetical protein